MIIDAFVIVVSYILAWWLKFSSGILDSPGGALSFGFYMKALVVIVPLYLILYYAFNLYTPKRVQGRRLEFSNVVMANIVGFLLIFTVLYNLQSYVYTFPLIRSCVPKGTPAIATVRPAVGTVPLAVRLPAVPQHCAQLQYAVSVKLPRYFP